MAKPTYLDLDFAKRISQVINIIGGTSETARQIGVSIPSIGRWKDGTSDPSRSNLAKLAKTACVSISWLATGDGQMYDHSHLPPKVEDTDNEYSYVPFYSTEASAGYGAFLDEFRHPTHHLAFRKRWLQAKGFALKDLVGLIAKGDSMEPTIKDNSAMIISTNRNEVMDGHIYVIRMGDRLWVKRVQWIVDGLRLISDNGFYAPIDVTNERMKSDDIEVIGQVVHCAYDLI